MNVFVSSSSHIVVIALPSFIMNVNEREGRCSLIPSLGLVLLLEKNTHTHTHTQLSDVFIIGHVF